MFTINYAGKAYLWAVLLDFFISSGAVILLPACASAESVSMRSGKVIEGAIVGKDGESVTVKKDDGSLFVIPFNMMTKDSADKLQRLPDKKEEPPAQPEVQAAAPKALQDAAKAETKPAEEAAAPLPVKDHDAACVGQTVERRTHGVLNVSVCLPDGWKDKKLESPVSDKSMAFHDLRGGLIVLNLEPEGNIDDRFALVRKANGPVVEEGDLGDKYSAVRWFVFDKKGHRTIIYMFQDAGKRAFSIIASAEETMFAGYRPVYDDVARSFLSSAEGI